MKTFLLKRYAHGRVLQTVCPPRHEKELFMKMLNDCYEYASAINAKGEPFPSEPLIMALLLSQHKIIEWLTDKISRRVKWNQRVDPRF